MPKNLLNYLFLLLISLNAIAKSSIENAAEKIMAQSISNSWDLEKVKYIEDRLREIPELKLLAPAKLNSIINDIALAVPTNAFGDHELSEYVDIIKVALSARNIVVSDAPLGNDSGNHPEVKKNVTLELAENIMTQANSLSWTTNKTEMVFKLLINIPEFLQLPRLMVFDVAREMATSVPFNSGIQTIDDYLKPIHSILDKRKIHLGGCIGPLGLLKK